MCVQQKLSEWFHDLLAVSAEAASLYLFPLTLPSPHYGERELTPSPLNGERVGGGGWPTLCFKLARDGSLLARAHVLDLSRTWASSSSPATTTYGMLRSPAYLNCLPICPPQDTRRRAAGGHRQFGGTQIAGKRERISNFLGVPHRHHHVGWRGIEPLGEDAALGHHHDDPFEPEREPAGRHVLLENMPARLLYRPPPPSEPARSETATSTIAPV